MLTTETDIAEGIQDKYFLKFGTATRETVRVFRSPGRINLIGEHTDYNNGFVLPASVDKAVYFVIAPREDEQVILYAADLDQTYSFFLDDLSKPEKSWPHYQLGIVEQIQKKA